MKTVNEQALNRVNIVGKLLDTTFREGKLEDGRPYESVNMTVRVTQTYGGREETSDIPVSMFAAKYTKKNTSNPGYEQIMALHSAKTVQNVGIDDADIVRINSGFLRENNFVTKSGQLINGWQLNTSFINVGGSATDVASFTTDIFILDMRAEEDRDGDTTGHLIVKGGVVQYGGNLDVFEFIVENPDAVNYIERNWNINDTVNVKGRIRVTADEVKVSGTESSWGEEIPEMTTRTVRELIITKGDDEGKEDDLAYDPAEIKKAFNVRKAKIEQLQINATQKASKAAAATSTENSSAKYSWE